MKVSPHPSLRTLQSGARLLGLLRLQGPVAQSGERRPRMAEVRGSSPLGSTPFLSLFAGKTRTRQEGRILLQPCLTVTRFILGRLPSPQRPGLPSSPQELASGKLADLAEAVLGLKERINTLTRS
jgi:hypothetical protein